MICDWWPRLWVFGDFWGCSMREFYLKEGQMAFCKFQGLQMPEMVKERPVIILTKPLPLRDRELYTVVPLSTTKPPKILDWHYKLDKQYLPTTSFFKDKNGEYNECWVKADMIYTLSIKRMWLIRMGKLPNGRDRYFYNVLPDEIMKYIKNAVWSAIDYSAEKYKNGGR